MPRLFGQLDGELTFGDRATYFGEIFDFSPTKTPTGGDSPWTNLPGAAVRWTNIRASAVLPGAAVRWTNIRASAVSENFVNLTAAGGTDWENLT